MFGNDDEVEEYDTPRVVFKKYVPSKALLFDYTSNEGDLAKIFE